MDSIDITDTNGIISRNINGFLASIEDEATRESCRESVEELLDIANSVVSTFGGFGPSARVVHTDFGDFFEVNYTVGENILVESDVRDSGSVSWNVAVDGESVDMWTDTVVRQQPVSRLRGVLTGVLTNTPFFATGQFSAADFLSMALNKVFLPGAVTVGMGDKELVVYIHADDVLTSRIPAEMSGYPVRTVMMGPVVPA